MEKEKIADLFKSGIDCSQVVLAHFAKKVGLTAESAERLGACFGGGMGRGESCGAIVGAMIAIGARYGHTSDAIEKKDIMAKKRAEFFDAISERYPSSLCRDILGHDISDPDGLKAVLDQGLLFSLCPALCADVIELLEKIL